MAMEVLGIIKWRIISGQAFALEVRGSNNGDDEEADDDVNKWQQEQGSRRNPKTRENGDNKVKC